MIVTSILGFCNNYCYMLCCSLRCAHSNFCNHIEGKERAGCFALFVFMVSRDSYKALPYGATGYLLFVIVKFPDHTHLLFL